MDALRSHFVMVVDFLRSHQLLEGAIIIVIGTMLAALVRQISSSFFRFLADRHGLNLEQIFGEKLTRTLWLTVILISFHRATPMVVGASTEANFVLQGISESLLVILWAVTIGRIFRVMSLKKRTGKFHNLEMIQFGCNIGIALVVINAGFMLLAVWRVDITPLLASAGIVGLAVALAAKDTLANFFGGINLFVDRPFKQGDYVVLGTGERGEIVEIGLRSTRILTRDDVMVSIPNAVIAGSKIVNESAPEPHFRVRLKISVAYGSDVDLVESNLIRIAKQEKLVAENPEPRVRFRSFGDSSLEFELLCWAQSPDRRGLMQHKLNKTIYKEFNDLGIVFPFPQREVYIHHSVNPVE